MASKRALIHAQSFFSPLQTSNASISLLPRNTYRFKSQSSTQWPEQVKGDDLKDLLTRSTWSVESLLPSKTEARDAPEISSEHLHHLLRLSALPLPENQEEEAKMLQNLSAQLHFVGKMQQVDTTDIKPLRAIRDETSEAEKEHTITMDMLKDALAREKTIGKHYKRIQRNTDAVDTKDVENWDVLGSAERKVGRFFVVESERPQE
ncbi:hypothetical protein CC78DRAFT_320112 [Lojkania enalia]|uniref:Glutamyl-tRNA amidotransferase complex subunit Gta3 domain-containing protein n=1 Tax=Lojkania enalia TaxID=147567 RepID=A0A9P4K3P6_9PLEO|nr:hypothetical protein CC78DRAFT_320112 [Didymosphaeria enalia]